MAPAGYVGLVETVETFDICLFVLGSGFLFDAC